MPCIIPVGTDIGLSVVACLAILDLDSIMPINSDKPHLWKEDVAQSVDLFNQWFVRFAPKAYRDTRQETTARVEDALVATEDLASITPVVLKANPQILPTLRMATCPPLARDRLIGLSHANPNLVRGLENGRLPARSDTAVLHAQLNAICSVIRQMFDRDIFPWLGARTRPTPADRHRASTIVADRLCGAIADPIIRNAQEQRQLKCIRSYLEKKGYHMQPPPAGQAPTEMKPGTFSFRTNLVVGKSPRQVRIPIDVMIQSKNPGRTRMPLLIEAKSAGDFTNTNKRRKEEATKVHQIRATFGERTHFILFLCGYFDSGYLGYEAAEGIDWVWEHRIEDMDRLGI